MGMFQSDYLIVELWGENETQNTKDIDKVINRIKKPYRSLVFKIKHLTNCGISYFMCYDGSKEGWPRSEKADEIRERIIKAVLKSYPKATILHIRPKGELNQYTDEIIRIEKEGYDVQKPKA